MNMPLANQSIAATQPETPIGTNKGPARAPGSAVLNSESAGMGQLESVEGVIERISFRNVESGFTILRLGVMGRREPVTAVGNLGPVAVGEGLQLQGAWIKHPDYGPQFQFTSYELRRPSTTENVEKYLASGVVAGIGPAMAKRLAQRFGAETLLIIEHQPHRLAEVPGVGPKRIESIRAALTERRAVQDIALFLQDCGVSPAFAERLFRHYGASAIGAIKSGPYALTETVRGIGFRTADLIARSLGIENDDPARMAAGLVYTLSCASNDGHTYLPLPQLYGRAQKILEVSLDRLLPMLPSLVESESLITEEDGKNGTIRVFLPALYRAEVGVASRLARLEGSPGPKPLPAARVLQWLDRRRTSGEVELSAQQREALTLAMTERVCVITGGPGTGKSTIMRALVRAFETAGRTVLLASPTGRAARRLSEVTGRPATTLHRLLEFDPQRHAFRRDHQNPLVADLLIVDEASMLDIVLANNLVKAVRPGAHLVLIGDTDQLPSVGPGNVLRDLLASETVPTYRLTHVFRQALGSLAVRNAHRVNRGEMPELIHPSRREEGDCVFLEAADPSAAIQLVCQLLRVSLPRQGFGPDAVQTLAPMNKGPLGILALNEAIQGALNPASPEKLEVTRAGVVYRVGDRVIQLVNDYDRDVFNGDVGQITHIDLNNSSLTVAFPTIFMESSQRSGATETSAAPGTVTNISPREEGRLAAETRAPYISLERGAAAPGPAGQIAPFDYGSSPLTVPLAGGAAESSQAPITRLRSVQYPFTDLDELQLAYAMTVHKAQGSEFPVVILLLHEVHGPMLQRNLFYTGLTRGRKLTIIIGMRSAVGQAVARQTQQQRLTALSDRLRSEHNLLIRPSEERT